jgi:hypothetical protein
VDGVPLLYASSQSVRQRGSALDLRLGVTREMEGDRLAELTLLHHRFSNRHDVLYVRQWWNPSLQRPETDVREERNLDRSTVWGAQLRHTLPLDEGLRVGFLLAGNRHSHPKIPNYELMNIPRDPGHSNAFNVGVGVALHEGRARAGAEIVYEPIRSHTWSDSDTTVTAVTGRAIPAGDPLVENHFRFGNAVFRTGLGREGERWGFQLGLQVRAIRYDLDQTDHVRTLQRAQQESWMEWTPTWSLGARFPEFHVRYSGRVTSGTGRPGVAFGGFRAADSALSSTFILAPSGPLTLQESMVWTHQIGATIPVR